MNVFTGKMQAGRLMFLSVLCIVFASFYGIIRAQDTLPRQAGPDTARLRILFAGDMMGHMPLVNSCLTLSGTYNYIPIFENVRSYIASADIAMANLELTLAGPPYAGYPQFSSPDAVAKALKSTGFNVLVTANNHALDRGSEGIDRTVDILDSLQLYHTGTFKDSTDKRLRDPLFITKNGIKLALLNYTYGTNEIKPKVPVIVNYIDTASIRRDVDSCRVHKADFIIVVLHWGVEYERYPNAFQYKIASFIRSLGVNAIIGSHPHVVQPVVLYKNANDSAGYIPVVYSLGNFVSNQRDRYKDGGIVFELDLWKVHHTHITSVSYLPVWVFKGLINGKLAFRLIPPMDLSEAAARYKMSDDDRQKATQFFSDTEEHLKNIPVSNLAVSAADRLQVSK